MAMQQNVFILGWTTLLCLAVASPLSAHAAIDATTKKVFQANCVSCHSPTGSASGVLPSFEEKDLIQRGLIVPGDPNASRLFKRVNSGEMPPGIPLQNPAQAKAALRSWIEKLKKPVAPSGALVHVSKPKATSAKSTEPVVNNRPECVPETQLIEEAKSDLEKTPTADRNFTRYLSLAPGWNPSGTRAGVANESAGVLKALNSVNWSSQLITEKLVGKSQLLLKIDLRDLKEFGGVRSWSADMWNSLQDANPINAITSPQQAAIFKSLTGTNSPLMTSDAFVGTVLKEPNYSRIMGTGADQNFVKRILVDEDSHDVTRAGNRRSGVSKNNRIIERRATASYPGTYWSSFDFKSSDNTNDISDHPLDGSFAGGEFIYTLPNGMLAFALTNNQGKKIFRGPAQIVQDLLRADQTVTNPVSCFRCHAQGFLNMTDTVRDNVEAHPKRFDQATRDQVRALFPPASQFQSQVQKDTRRFRASLGKITPSDATHDDPVTPLVDRFDKGLPLSQFACELGVTPEKLAVALPTLVNEGLSLDPDTHCIAPQSLQIGDFTRWVKRIRELTQ